MEKNLIDQFKKDARPYFSNLSPKKCFDEEQIIFIEKMLLKNFGRGAFDRDKIDPENWIAFMLVNADYKESILDLNDVAKSLSFLETYSEPTKSHYKTELISKWKDAWGLQATMFEIFIDRLFLTNSVNPIKDYSENDQPIDAVININSMTFLIECRLTSSPANKKGKILMKMIQDLTYYFNNNVLDKDLSFIYEVVFEEPEMKLKNFGVNTFKEFWKNYNRDICLFMRPTIKPYSMIRLYPYEKAEEIAIENNLGGMSRFAIIRPEKSNKAKFGCVSRYSISEKQERFDSFLKEKRRQHKNSRIADKIFVFDCQSTYHYLKPLFNSSSELKEITIRPKHNEIILFVFRKSLNNKFKTELKVYAGENHKATAKIIESWKLN